MKVRLGIFAAMLGAAVLAGTAPSRATVVTGGIEISSSGSCVIAGFSCSGSFTIDNETSDWEVTGFSVTDSPGAPFESESANAITTRTDWSASASVNYIDPICFYDFCFGGEPQPTFSYDGSTNFILPGQSDGSFGWSETADLDPIYTFNVLDISTEASASCGGSLGPLTGPTSSSCTPSLSPVPEPSSLPLLLAGLGLIGGAVYFGRKKATTRI